MRIKIKTPEVIKELKFLREVDRAIYERFIGELILIITILLLSALTVYLMYKVDTLKEQLRKAVESQESTMSQALIESMQAVEPPLVIEMPETPLPRIRITVRYTESNETERIIESYSNEIDTGNTAIDTALAEYLDRHMDGHVKKGEDICD